VENLSLKELKAKNADTEIVNEDVKVADVKEDVKDEYVEVDKLGKAVEVESNAELDEAIDKTEIEGWMQTEDAETSDDEKKGGFVPSHEAASRRKKAKALRGELNDTQDENQQLKEKLAAYEAGNAPQVQKQDELAPRPTREQFDFDDDAYDAAVDKWNDQKFDMKLNAHSQTRETKNQQESQQKAQQETFTKNLDSHYDRAQKLIDEGKITDEAFRNSDKIVRQAMENVFPQNGNRQTDALISALNSLGDDSEKVMYQLGVNPAKLHELQTLLSNDPSGLTAMGYLGKLQAGIKTPKAKNSQAPAPGSHVEGEGGNDGKAGALHKQYTNAKTVQERITLKRAARQQKVDTRNW